MILEARLVSLDQVRLDLDLVNLATINLNLLHPRRVMLVFRNPVNTGLN